MAKLANLLTSKELKALAVAKQILIADRPRIEANWNKFLYSRLKKPSEHELELRRFELMQKSV